MSTPQFLLLEDNPLDVEAIQTVLTDSGIQCELFTVATCTEFIKALETQKFDLILAAYALPGFDGITALEIACQRCADVPFIFVSASLGEELAIEALKRGATDYVLKQRLGRLGHCVHRALLEAQERRGQLAALHKRQQAERLRIEQNHLLGQIASGQPLEDCLAALCRSISQLSPHMRACFRLTDAQRLAFPRAITPDFLPSFNQELQNIPINDLCLSTCGEAVYRSEPVTCTDIANDNRWSSDWRNLCIAHGILACHSRPVLGADRFPLASLMLCLDEARSLTSWECQLADFGIQTASIVFERDRSNMALRQNEARLQAVAANLPNGAVFIVDHELRYQLAEGKALENEGFTPDHFVGKVLGQVLDPTLAAYYEPHYRQLLSGQSFTQEHYSHTRYYVTHGTPLRNNSGEIDAALVVSYDISDRKKIEQERERFLAIGSDLQVITGIDGYFQWVSPTFERTLGWTVDEMKARPWIDFVHPDDRHSSTLEAESLFSGSKTTDFENRYQHKDGSYRWFLWNSQPYTDEQVLYATAIDITARKQAEAVLRQSEEQLRAIYDGTHAYIGLLTPDGTLLEANHAALAFSGINRDEVIGRPFWETVWFQYTPNAPETVRQAIAKAAAGEFVRYKAPLITPDGQIMMFDISFHPTRNEQGDVILIVPEARDITEHQWAETALHQSEEKSRQILESISDAFFAVDENWLYTYVNREAEVLLDRTPGDLIGKSLWEEYPGLVGSQFEQLYRYVATERVADSLTAFYADHERWYEVRAYPAVSGITIYFRNVTDRIQAETALRETSAALERQLQKFNAVISSVPDFIYTFDLSGRFIDVNKPLLDLWQIPLNEAIGKNFFDLNYSAELATKLQGQIQEVIQTRRSIKDELLYTRAFETRAYEYIFVPIFDTQGMVEMVAGVTRDITERKQAEAEREQLLYQEQTARETSEQAHRVKDEFLAVLSHELRSPLNPILGWARLLLHNKLDKNRQTEALKTIERNAKLQSQLIEDLLDISRIMQGKLALKAAPVSLTSVIAAAIETVRLAADAKTIQITLNLDNAIAPVFGDIARLQQVIWNLLANAVKFTQHGGKITIELKQIERLAQIRVIDTGKGICPNFLPHIFEYFRQEDGSTTRKFGGLGLGLAIAQQIVEMHGGTIRAESQGKEQGSTFIVRLPVMSQAAPVLSESPHPQTNKKAPLDNIQVLLVDDDSDTREFQAFLLTQNGACVTAVACAREALQTLEQFAPDVIVSDIGMAEIDGYMLIKQIRNREASLNQLCPSTARPLIPAIALTAYAAELDQQKALQAGFQTHITKPIEPEILVQAIVNLLAPSKTKTSRS